MRKKRLPRITAWEVKAVEQEKSFLDKLEPILEGEIKLGHTDVGGEIAFHSPALSKDRTFFGTLQMKLDQLRYHRVLVEARLEKIRTPPPAHFAPQAA